MKVVQIKIIHVFSVCICSCALSFPRVSYFCSLFLLVIEMYNMPLLVDWISVSTIKHVFP